VGLVGGGVGAAVALGDGHQRHELAGVGGGHLWAVIPPGHQDRGGIVIAGRGVVGRRVVVAAGQLAGPPASVGESNAPL
jgi:hypothetical protein